MGRWPGLILSVITSHQPPIATIRMESLDPIFTAGALAWAQHLHLKMEDNAEFALQLGHEGLQFSELGPHAAGPIRVDFVSGAVAHRRLFGGGSGQMIAKAVGIQAGVRPIVVDATAGLGRDAFVLAELGCAITLIERQPLIAALLEDGMRRALDDAEVGPIVARMTLLCGNAIELLRDWENEAPQVIYLDPMFPHRDKSALMKKEMRLFRPLVGDDDDAPALLEVALALATHRVVVKRPRKAQAIAGRPPTYALEGKSSRFDIYPKKTLKTKAD